MPHGRRLLVASGTFVDAVCVKRKILGPTALQLDHYLGLPPKITTKDPASCGGHCTVALRTSGCSAPSTSAPLS